MGGLVCGIVIDSDSTSDNDGDSQTANGEVAGGGVNEGFSGRLEAALFLPEFTSTMSTISTSPGPQLGLILSIHIDLDDLVSSPWGRSSLSVPS